MFIYGISVQYVQAIIGHFWWRTEKVKVQPRKEHFVQISLCETAHTLEEHWWFRTQLWFDHLFSVSTASIPVTSLQGVPMLCPGLHVFPRSSYFSLPTSWNYNLHFNKHIFKTKKCSQVTFSLNSLRNSSLWFNTI